METLFCFAPAYNEAENIYNFVTTWHVELEKIASDETKVCLCCIDDGSQDGTYCTLRELQKDFPLLIPLTKPNGGHGETCMYGYRYALENGADYIFQTDSDGQTNPKEFPSFWSQRHNYDAIFGNRVKRGDGKSRALVEQVVCLLTQIFFGGGASPTRMLHLGS